MNMDNLNDSIPEDLVAEFILAPLREELTNIPEMIDPNIAILRNIGIVNTYQLVGFFLSFKHANQSSKELYNNIKTMLDTTGLHNSRVVIITLLEKIDVMMSGFCDMSEIYGI
jgi:hypothetical protein